jgi:hypothetical protein
MTSLFLFIIAGGLGVFFTLIETATSKFPNTWIFLITKSKNIYFYSLIYGIINIIFLFLLLWMVSEQIIQMSNHFFKNPYILSIIVGISTKAILHINLFSAKIGMQNVPIGLETFTLIFEPYFINQIYLDEYNYVQEYIDKKIDKSLSLHQVKEKIKNGVPYLSNREWQTFLLDLRERNTVASAMDLYLKSYGKKNFERIFK